MQFYRVRWVLSHTMKICAIGNSRKRHRLLPSVRFPHLVASIHVPTCPDRRIIASTAEDLYLRTLLTAIVVVVLGLRICLQLFSRHGRVCDRLCDGEKKRLFISHRLCQSGASFNNKASPCTLMHRCDVMISNRFNMFQVTMAPNAGQDAQSVELPHGRGRGPWGNGTA